ncbi:hypothetical protein EH228_04620 [Erwinia endophytica]|uniref:hypothetical protein n=1 Tax=Erwinia endophytica TaxID=1563158 RepID=UPI00126603E8|nr:hypothetical protein [Erwinia endophytica]KAB8312965.1 hypothetical protein EH228_04620 [Erwinia endophytica]
MSANVFAGDRNIESVAYDLALALASGDQSIITPEKLIQRIADILPSCREVAKKKFNEENPEPKGKVFF